MIEIIVQSKRVGCYFIGGPNGLGVALERKPIWLHRFFMRVLLGWEWMEP